MGVSEKLEWTHWANTDIGLLENRVGPGVGYEVPAEFVAWGKGQGETYGAARVPSEEALADDSGPFIYIDGGVGVRKHLAAEVAARQSVPARRAGCPGTERKAQAEAQADSIRDQIPLLVGREDDAEAAEVVAADKFDAAVAERDLLSLTERGLIKSKWTLLFIEGGAVAFDCALLHSALEHSGAGSASVWLTSALAPAAIAGIHVTFGTLAGWIARKLPSGQRLKAAAGALAFGFGALLAAFVCLAVFREAGTAAMNQGLSEIAAGNESGELNLFVSSLWMAPLQIGSSISAVLAVALWVLGQPGRDADRKVADAEKTKDRAEVDREQATTKVERVRDQVRQARLSVHQISVDAREAEAENEGLKSALALRLGAEDALGQAIKGQFKTTFVATDRIYENGQVRRAAMGDEERRGSKVRRRPSRDVSEQSLTNPPTQNDKTGGRSVRRWFS
ncbi:MAG: hypothetical protein IPK93_12410 [Solirubrobacterales bacterium]|nr:hypothetical protein [Solirubrobacterales bacterium]